MIQYFLQFVVGIIQVFRQQGKISYTLQFAFDKIFFQCIAFFIKHIVGNDNEVVNDCKAFIFVHSQDTSTALNELA